MLARCTKIFFERFLISSFCANKFVGPVATAADGIEGQIGGALIDPSNYAATHSSTRARDELAARAWMREYTDVITDGFSIFQNGDLQNTKKN